MLIIQDVLISDDIINTHFICNLKACKGACCWEGDYGAPMLSDEMDHWKEYESVIKSNLKDESLLQISNKGLFHYYEEPQFYGTSLMPSGACVFMNKDEQGVAYCTIEKMYKNGDLPFNKPQSCHLYPIRIIRNEEAGFEAWNYDQWEICSAACDLGTEMKLPLYQFLKNAIIAYKGEAFYDELDHAAQHMSS